MFEQADTVKLLLGRLSWEAIAFHEPVLLALFVAVALGGLVWVGSMSYFGMWGRFWRHWVTSVDHKRVGLMYIVLGLVMLLPGVAGALMLLLQHALSAGDGPGYLSPHHYDQILTAHGVIMIFFVAMPLLTGFMNYLVPLQIGARGTAFPFLGNLGFWMTAFGAVLVMLSLFVGGFPQVGWLAYPPLSGIEFSPDVGVDYHVWALLIAGVGAMLSAINLIVTLVKMRCPGMGFMKMPPFTWSALCANVLIIAIFPVFMAALLLLALDRFAGTHFFTNDLGGNAMTYVSLIRAWVLPEVCVLMLPAFGIFSEITATFSGKRLFGYTAMVGATCSVTLLAVLVSLLHLLPLGAGTHTDTFLGLSTLIFAIPVGAMVLNWVFTLYRGAIRFEVPMMWVLGFLIIFVAAGLAGVQLAVRPANDVLHDSLFVTAFFHHVILGCVVHALMAGIAYWFPKAFGYQLIPFWGRLSFWCGFLGIGLAITPLYMLGLMGIPPRMSHIDDPSLQVGFLIAASGAGLILVGILSLIAQLVHSFIRRPALRDETGDPWDARTLEWSTASPPPDYNFAFTPVVHEIDAWWDMKRNGYVRPTRGFIPIPMRKNTAAGFTIAALGAVFGFCMIWQMWLLAGASFIVLLGALIVHACSHGRGFPITAAQVERTEAGRTRLLARHA